jgi:hypothetical protein
MKSWKMALFAKSLVEKKPPFLQFWAEDMKVLDFHTLDRVIFLFNALNFALGIRATCNIRYQE